VLGELRFSRPCKDTATEPLRKLTRASPGRSPSASGHSPEPPGSTERLRAFTGAPSLTDGTFGTHRRPAAARTTSVVHRTTSVAHQVRRVRHERPRMLTGTSGFHPSPFGDSKPVRPNSPFNGDSIVSLQRTTRSKAPGRTVQRLWRHGGHFRVDPRLSSLLSTLNLTGPRQPDERKLGIVNKRHILST
jgi:hypothetical protein